MTRYSNNTLANITAAPAINIMQIYEDSGNTYVCLAPPGSILTDAVWKIERFDSAGNKRKCDGDDKFDNVATDASTVAALSYS